MDINQLTRIFCDVDDFCNELNHYARSQLLPSPQVTSRRGPARCLHDSEIMAIVIFFQSSGYRHFKHFYLGYLSRYWAVEFPRLPSYNRFI